MTDRSHLHRHAQAVPGAQLIADSEGERARRRLERKLERLTELIDDLHDRLDDLAGEVRTRRLVVVDEEGVERVVAESVIDAGSLVVSGRASHGRGKDSICAIQPHRFMLLHPAGAHLIAMVTADDAEIVVHSGPDDVVTSPHASRIQLHAARGWDEDEGGRVACRSEVVAIAGNGEREDGISVIGDWLLPDKWRLILDRSRSTARRQSPRAGEGEKADERRKEVEDDDELEEGHEIEEVGEEGA